nr:GIY-YIG nuclease family protein [uncultured Hyphomonas sp.]
MEGIIYILTNEAMPGYVKIGKTTSSVEQRMRELDTTGIPLPFECFFAGRVANCHVAEKLLHDAFSDHRVRSRREFFQISPERIASALRLAAPVDVTPRDDVVEDAEDEAALNKARERRSNFNFSIIGLEPGQMLNHVKDETVTCIIVDNTKVLFQNEEMSLSKAALKALHDMGYSWKAVSGSEYWEFKGQTLDERRREIEEG